MLGSSTTLEKFGLQVHTCSSVCFRDIEFLLVFDLKITEKMFNFEGVGSPFFKIYNFIAIHKNFPLYSKSDLKVSRPKLYQIQWYINSITIG